MKTKETAFGLLWGESWAMPSRSDSPARTERPIARSGEEYGVRTVHWTVRHAELAWWAPSQLSSRKVDAARLEATPCRSDSPARTNSPIARSGEEYGAANSPLDCSPCGTRLVGGSLQPWLGAWLPRPCSFCWWGWRLAGVLFGCGGRVGFCGVCGRGRLGVNGAGGRHGGHGLLVQQPRPGCRVRRGLCDAHSTFRQHGCGGGRRRHGGRLHGRHHARGHLRGVGPA